ncbi:MAG: MFS transporter [Rhizobiales bacterium]|nr:MFS transporter [Hyphomicrobiales bacterium]NRB13744.1 MFS transporter [Hyphomicrobiales bacterium]
MIDVLKHTIFARLFGAQVIALLGTGLLTVALGLLAFDLAGDKAGAVLGTAFAIKMIAYVGLAPISAAIVDKLPRKAVLICADLVRAGIVIFLPFVSSIWQIYVLIFVLQVASATFTPAFQSIIPDILSDEKDYTKALSLSRLAYDLENLISPMLAGILLTLMNFHWLFGGTIVGFIASAVLVSVTSIPAATQSHINRTFIDKLTRGIRIYLATPRLRGLLALNFTAAAVGAFILVNTVMIVRVGYGATETQVAYALAAFGGGSMLAALALPRMLEIMPDRIVMIWAAIIIASLTIVHAVYIVFGGLPPWGMLLFVWAASGVLYSAILTPSGRLLKHSAHTVDRPAIFVAQFSLSHVCWLVTYPIAGWAGLVFGLPITMAILGIMALISAGFATLVWPANDTKEVFHDHPELSLDHPHLERYQGEGKHHSHVFVIDDEHRIWPTHG